MTICKVGSFVYFGDIDEGACFYKYYKDVELFCLTYEIDCHDVLKLYLNVAINLFFKMLPLNVFA